MNKSTDVIVVGSGLAGLMAAHAAVKKGASVKLVSEGMGNLSISPGCIDLLGYDKNGERLEDPWSGMAQLPAYHPYSLLGREVIETSLNELCSALESRGYKLASNGSSNTLLPTIMGTFKPTWLASADVAHDTIHNAQKILVLSVRGFRDCRPQLITSQLRRYKDWENKSYDTLVLPAPFEEHGRAINALDLAHMLDRPHGLDWFMNKVKDIGKKYDLVLMPPLLGAKPDSPARKKVADGLGCPYVEMLSVPPGVAGLRIRKALVNLLVEQGVEFYENARVTGATIKDGKGESIQIYSTGREKTLTAKAFVVATGGVISGGVILGQGKAKEAVFGVEIPVPADVDDWSEPEVFGQHLVSRMGVKVDASLRCAELENVHFAGRTLGGYDYAAEKSGHGVACSTGWQAGTLATAHALGGN